MLYVGLGIAVPAAVIANRPEAEGGVGNLRTTELTKQQELGKTLFVENCKSCHTLAAVQAHGVTGPNLDELGGVDKQRVLNAIKNGGTGQGRMPKDLLSGNDARPSPATWPRSPASRAFEKAPHPPGFSVRRLRCADSMPASKKAEVPLSAERGGTTKAVRPGANRQQGVAPLFQREPVS